MRYPTSTFVIAALLATGCEGALVIDTSGGGGGGPMVRWDAGPGVSLDGGARPWDAGPGAAPGCPLPAEGLCDGEIARWCQGTTELFSDCGSLGHTCRIVSGRASCVPSGDPDPNPDPDPDPEVPTGCAGPEEQRVIDLVNGERGSPLRCDEDMARTARNHSQDMCDNDYFSHTALDGRSPFDRMEDEGVTYSTAGENIAWGQQTPEDVHSSWMNSSGHRANIMNSSFGRIGVGYVSCGGSPYWTQVFAD